MSLTVGTGNSQICCCPSIFYVNGISNPDRNETEDKIIPLIQNICSVVIEKVTVHLLYNDATPNSQELIKQIVSNNDESIIKTASRIAVEISEYLDASNQIVIIGHSQGVAVIDKVLDCIPDFSDRVHVIALGGVKSLENHNIHKIEEFSHQKDGPRDWARYIWHRNSVQHPFFPISNPCLDKFCHGIDTYLSDEKVKKAIQDALRYIINTPSNSDS